MDDTRRLDEQLQQLHLHYIRSHYQEQANKATEQQHPHVHYLGQLIEGEASARENRAQITNTEVSFRAQQRQCIV